MGRARSYVEARGWTGRTDPEQMLDELQVRGIRNIALKLGAQGALLREGITLCWELRDRRSLAYSLEAFARLAAHQTQWERATLLFAAASTLRLSLPAPLPPQEWVESIQPLLT